MLPEETKGEIFGTKQNLSKNNITMGTDCKCTRNSHYFDQNLSLTAETCGKGDYISLELWQTSERLNMQVSDFHVKSVKLAIK